METPVSTEISQAELDAPYTVENEIKVETLQYHGKTLKLFQMEHQERLNTTTGVRETVSTQWREKLTPEISRGDDVFLEYFPPELKKAQKIPIVGMLVGMWMRQSGIDMFADMAEVVSAQEANVKVADVASGPIYAWHEVAVDYPRWKQEMIKRPIEDRVGHSGDGAGVDPLELSMPRAIDQRRLMTARAIMQDAIENKDAQNIVWVGPEAHALRIRAYIERQIEYENQYGILEKASNMSSSCPPEEKTKIETYKHKLGFNNKIRTFAKNKLGWWFLKNKEIIY